MTTHDVAVVGAGIVGLAVAREILLRRPGTSLAVLEKEPAIALHQSGHSSGVVHSGLYYEPGSLKARLCVAGSTALYAYCAEQGIPVERCGKVVVATTDAELARLEALYRRGVANAVPGLARIGPAELAELEPHCRGLRALWSPGTGIVDYRRVAAAMAAEVRAAGGEVLTGREVLGVRTGAASGGGVLLETALGELSAARVLTCGGLHSDRLARLSGTAGGPRIVPFRGDYWQLRPERRHLAKNLIYPVPDPALPFLGVHFTRQLADGAVWLGPNAVLAFAREGYRRGDVRPAELGQVLTYPGFRRLARTYWRQGLTELHRDMSRRAFVASCRRLVPELSVDDVVPGPSGVRAQSLTADGTLADDFLVDVQGPRLMHVRNAPSPGATSSLALARLIVDTWDRAA